MSGDNNESAAGQRKSSRWSDVAAFDRNVFSRFVYFGGWDGATKTGRVPVRMSGWP